MNETTALPSARSYLDFSGLGELRGKAQQHDDAALKETAQHFEALFIQMMLKSMRDAAQANDADAFNDKVDYPKVRESLKGPGSVPGEQEWRREHRNVWQLRLQKGSRQHPDSPEGTRQCGGSLCSGPAALWQADLGHL